MRKIGIVTIHKINNYGALLQAYALNRYLRNCGHQVQTIDYRTYRVKESYQIFRPMKSVMDLPRNAQALLYAARLRRRKHRFDAFLRDYVPMTTGVYEDNGQIRDAKLDFDTYICGSDQIWNTYCQNYDNTFLLDFADESARRIAYAASLGATGIHENHQESFSRELKKFHALSVRENDAVEIIRSYADKAVTHVCDPVFLPDLSQWEAVATEPLLKEPYIFCYHVKGDIPAMREYMRELSQKTGMKIVTVNLNLREMLFPCVKRYDAGPQEFLSLIKNAAFVCTNSFHAASFSLIFRKKFMVFAPGAGASRVSSLLEKAGLEDRLYGDACADIAEDIDYDRVWAGLEPFVAQSKEFLKAAVEES